MKKEKMTKILLTIPIELKEELIMEAEAEYRSLMNYMLLTLVRRNKKE